MSTPYNHQALRCLICGTTFPVFGKTTHHAQQTEMAFRSHPCAQGRQLRSGEDYSLLRRELAWKAINKGGVA